MYGGIQVVRDSDFVSAQYVENELMECIRMEKVYRIGSGMVK